MVRSKLAAGRKGKKNGASQYSACTCMRNQTTQKETASVGCWPHYFDFIDFRSARFFIHLAELRA
ncbi:hypothetical protein [Cupriavidus sp.]|uniref:hypothetical protein n=1 Tax=Cupriavidus sp. TaxID=1873897 RepID=UPI0031D6E5F3